MTTVLISGASVAGPALAWFLRRDGHRVTVVERAPELRDAGYAVDFRGAALDVLAEMEILDEVRSHRTRMAGTTLLAEDGSVTGELPASAFGGDLEVPKRALTRILHRVTDAEFLFGDTITALVQHDGRVTASFEHAPTRDFDLVVGADGVRSAVRRIAFPGVDPLEHLGMSGAGFTTDNHFGLDRRGLLQPGAGRAIFALCAGDPARMTVSLSFATSSAELDRRDRAVQEAAVRAAFADHPWPATRRLLSEMTAADDFYFASACQVHLDSWSTGRVVLLGDAGYCAAPTSGMGTSQALIGASTLARCLAEADGDHTAAFDRYEKEMRPYVTANQTLGREAVSSFGG
ncbi:FAD-dependent monooxygenase [Actinoplanes teichomyceticus]|uniref:2-polyprenyl-6-methoxyphenol hydroxylase-like FAD-dependent oxidoreductase n=1 Tax=Actinoplanes teichomyceticus TaxID=1867 RepID=A0A561VLW3_ACTTI|nr:FAD-dependent monooxygenase [Actinoplanes teichomyceticus]TWG12614.1 2-polyprenyl-6-methoxyphenol hydroxylase-like FAD-dependent oxidoreductase [Actinoplanes teichomyceticus]GIF13984.1 FAD-dependent oxidoreductase [Actinoplanes teichomyceticus]